MKNMEPVLKIDNLTVEYFRKKQVIPAVENVSLDLYPSERVGIVGESGCGKSTIAQSVLNLIQKSEGRIIRGNVIYNGKNLLKMASKDLNEIRGKKISLIPQDPFSSLNPVLRIDTQMYEVFPGIKDKKILREKSAELLAKVHLKKPREVLESYPHQLSGGMRQRALIAMAIASNPDIIIADEPTTALDVTIQKEILDLISELTVSLKTALILITHNLGIVNERTERVFVLYAGMMVEEISTADIFSKARHPYTRALIKAVPKLGSREHPEVIDGQAPDPRDFPKGCRFHTRCPKIFEPCSKKMPDLKGKVRCFLYG